MPNFRGKRQLVFLWNKTIDILLLIKKFIFVLRDFLIKKIVKPPSVKSIDDTIDLLIKHKYSISRYGDGELKLIAGKDISFQKNSPILQNRLKEILVSNTPGHIVGIPDIFGGNKQYTSTEANAWNNHLLNYRLSWYKNLDKDKEYFNSFISRCYLCFQNRDKSRNYFEKLKKIWNQRNIVIIEGEYSRLGVGNDLFCHARSIKRVLCPSKHVFSKYNEILSFSKTLNKEDLILLALGPTATVLAFDLHTLGYQAIDLGHVDVEYEWFLMGATQKEKIKNKFVNEVNAGEFEKGYIDNEYFEEIIYQITPGNEKPNLMEIN